MPSGVEHSELLKNMLTPITVAAAPMPSGVEHSDVQREFLADITVAAAPMPSGVEHVRAAAAEVAPEAAGRRRSDAFGR